MYCSRRLYKGNSYEICLPLVDSGVTMVRFYTTGSVIVEKEPEIVEDSMCFSFTEEELAVLPDGVLRMEVVTEYETIDTNTPYVIVTPGDYSGKTIDDITEEAYQSGYTDGQAACEDCTDYYNSGYTEGEAAQKAKLVSTAITENGTYSREDGFSSVTVEIQQTGYTQQDIDNAYASGYTDGYQSGYDSGYTDGYNSGYTDGYDSGYTDGEASCHDYSRDYLTLEALESGVINTPSRMQYSKNGGEWLSSPTQVQVSAGDKIRYKGLRNNYSNLFGSITTKCNVYGNIMSVFYGDDFIGKDTLETGTSMYSFFMNSTGLVDASNFVIPIMDYSTMDSGTGLAGNMFQGCTSLVSAPELPATTLAFLCYAYMFYNCTSLENAPELPATNLAHACYAGMFMNCTSLETAPELPATTLAGDCYGRMFEGCTSLESAPVLSADTLVRECYEQMFKECTNINYIECLATDIPDQSSTYDWVDGVASAGTFVHPCGVEWTRGISGIPDNWQEIDGCSHDYSLDHTTMEIMTGGTIQFGKAVADAPDAVLDYSLDSGSTWTTITSSTSPYVIQVQAGDVLMFRGDNPHGLGDYIGGSSGSNNTFSGSTAYFKVYGNIMSLISRTGFEEMTVAPSDRGVFSWLFMDTNVVEAKNLVLPAASGDICFNRMFANCEFITESPVIPRQAATGISTYFAMFSGCTSLNKVTALMTNLGTNGTSSWMDGVAQTGTFIKNPNMNSWSSGVNGIPTGWTVQDAT